MGPSSPALPPVDAIAAGWDVFGADNRWIGRVKRVGGDALEVSAPLRFWRRKRLRVDVALVGEVDCHLKQLRLAGLTRALAGLDM